MSSDVFYKLITSALSVRFEKLLVTKETTHIQVYQCVSESVEEACHAAVRSITKSLSIVVTKVTFDVTLSTTIILYNRVTVV